MNLRHGSPAGELRLDARREAEASRALRHPRRARLARGRTGLWTGLSRERTRLTGGAQRTQLNPRLALCGAGAPGRDLGGPLHRGRRGHAARGAEAAGELRRRSVRCLRQPAPRGQRPLTRLIPRPVQPGTPASPPTHPSIAAASRQLPCSLHLHRALMRAGTSQVHAVEDRGDGTYLVSYAAQVSGTCSMVVAVGRMPIRGSPFRLVVTPR